MTKKIYSSPEVDCAPVNSKDLMQSMNGSVGGGGNQNMFTAPGRGDIIGMLLVLFSLLPMSLFAWTGAGTSANPYQISSLADWNTLATNVSNGTAYSGVYFKQTADISGVTKMVGTPTNMFSGIYDGDGHTLTAAIEVAATGDWYNSADVGLFRDINGATIKNLHTAGTVYDSGGDYKYLAGIAGRANYSTLINCRSSVEVKSSRNGDATNGGLVGNSTGTTIEGCVFDGKLTTTANTSNCGGLVGWSNSNNPKTIVRNCLFAPAGFTASLATGWSATIGRDGGNSGNNYTVTNTYYTQAFGYTHQGKQLRSITAGEGVTVAPAAAATEYNVSGITSYGTGIKYDGVLYGGNGDAVSLNLSYDAPAGYTLDHYNVTNGTLTGSSSPYTFTITADADAAISAEWVRAYTAVMADGTEDASNWSISPNFAPEGTTITLNYTGSRNIESIEIGNTHTYYVNTTDDLATALANFNANPGSRLVLNVDVPTMTITAEEGVIDLNGHKVTNASSFFLQNNTLGKAITIKNGTVQGIDGNGGWADTYYGTVILENIYLPGDLYTDGHAFILNSGTYNRVQNYKKGDKPGTVTVYRGVRIVTRNSVNKSASQNGATSGTYIDLSEDAPVSPGITEVVPNAQWTFSMPAHDADVIVNYSDFEGHGTEDDPYLIPSTEVWNKLVDNVNNAAHNYANKYFRQTADISVTTMLGYRVSDEAFRTFNGIYDGYGHTLNVSINGSETFCAPFHCIANATIKNLVVTGTVSVSAATNLHPSGLVGVMVGTCALENCLVSANVSGSRYMGGLIGHSRQANFTITGCVFNGTLTTSGNYYAGGLTGWGGAASNSATITDCLFAGTYVGSGKFHPIGCFDGNTRAISNMYYTQAPSGGMTDGETHSFVRTTSYKGEQAYSVTAGTGVTVAAAGTPTASYNVSKLNLYGANGLAFDGVLYGGQGDAVSMNLTGGDNYTATTGTLSGTANPYTLTMAAANSEINFVPVASITTSGNVTTNYGTFSDALNHWENNSTLTLLANVTHDQTITVNNTRILDLNGFGIKRTGTGRVILLNASGNLTINDSNPDAEHKFTVTNAYGDAGLGVVNDELTSGYQTFLGGYITGGNGVDHGAGIENDATNGVVTINGGVFIGNRSTTHGGFYWGHTNKTLNMNGGRIIYNMTACQGAAIFIGNATMRLYGGEISHNYSTGGGRAHSGGICSAGNNNFYMHGAPIVTANIGGNSGATNQPNDICLESKIRVDEEMTNTTPIGIMMNLGGFDGTQRGQFSYDSEYIDNSTPSHFVGQNYGDDEPVRIGNALWMWNPTRDTHGTVAYQVTYDPRGGSAVTGQTVLSGEKASQPESPTKAGVSFVGWYKDILFSEAWDFASEVVNADITLYARYSNDAALVDAPTAKSGLIYAGAAQELVNAGVADGGIMKYSTDNSTWSNDIPMETVPGNYTVYYMVKGDATHEDLVPASNELHISIDPAPLTISADNKQTVYGAAAPAFTATFTGLVGGETESNLTGTLDLACPYAVGDGLGTYDITPSGLSSDNYDITYLGGTLTVSTPTSFTFGDEEDYLAVMAALNGQTLDVQINRSFVTGIYNTFCLPFSLNATQIASSPLAGVIMKDYIGADVTGEGAERDLNIHLTDLTQIEAGKPFLIKPETDLPNPMTFNGVTIGYYAQLGQKVEAEHVDFQGILAPYDLAAYSQSSPDYLGVGQDGRLYWADGNKSTGLMRAFRAFFHVKDAGTSNNAPVRRGMHAQFVEDAIQTPTGTESIQPSAISIQKVLRDGQLFIIRDGKTYTATGQEVK